MRETNPVVFVVDDDESVRKGLGRLIRSAGHRVEVFSSATEFLGRGSGNGSGCLVLDVQLPGLSGIDLQRRLVVSENDLPIIFLTGHGDIPMSVQAMKAGAVDFLTKPVDDRALMEAIHRAFTHLTQTRRARAELRDLQQRLSTLTARERQVLTRVVSGLLNKQIAAELGISEKTVKVHRGRVMHKMCVQSLAELVHLTEKLKAVSLPNGTRKDEVPRSVIGLAG